jgi:hypothetical protein
MVKKAAFTESIPDRKLKLILGAGGIVFLASTALLVGALFSLDITALRWWAGVATICALIGPIIGYLSGQATARAHREGIQTGVGVVMQAATQTADVRIRTVQAMRAPQRPPTPERANFNVYLPNPMELGTNAPEALPAFDDDNDVEIF